MKKFFLFISVVFVIALFSPKFVNASSISTDSAIAVSLYTELSRMGYDLNVPSDSEHGSFYNALEPIVDVITSTQDSINDCFLNIGENLFYDVVIVQSWIRTLFGSNLDQNYTIGSPYPSFFSQASYNATISSMNSMSSHFMTSDMLNFGINFNYPLIYMTTYNSSGGTRGWAIPEGTYSDVRCFFDTVTIRPYVSSSGTNYTFNANSLYLSWSNSVISQSKSRLDYAIGYNGSGSAYSQDVGIYFTCSASSLDDAYEQFYQYVDSICINVNWFVVRNGLSYTIPHQSFSTHKVGNSVDDGKAYVQLDPNYLTYNYDYSKTYYNSTVNNETINNYDFDLGFDINNDFNSTWNDVQTLPSIFDTNVSSASIGLIGTSDSASGIMSDIFGGLPIEIISIISLSLIMILVFGLLNRLLGG